MTNDQQEQLAEALDHLEQARALFLELSEAFMEGGEGSEDDDGEDAANLAEELENVTVQIEEIIASVDDLRDNI